MNTTITYFHPQRMAGLTREIDNFTVLYIANGDSILGNDVDVVYRRYVADYSKSADRRFFVTATRRRYATLDAAVRAVIKYRTAQPA